MIQMDFAKNFTCLCKDEVVSACWKTNSDTLVTVMILFEEESISMVIIPDNNHHDKTTVVPYLFTVSIYVKEMFRENIQNIWTDMAHLVTLKISLSLATLVITFLSCFFIIIMQHGIIQLEVMERGLWMFWRHHEMIS